MIQVSIDSIRVSLISQHRVIVLKDETTERFLPIWIGPYEADAITITLQGIRVARPLTHDLLRLVVEAMGATVSHVVISDLRDETFYAVIYLDADGEPVEVDARPSDAIALAVRAEAPIFVAEHVLDLAGIVPEVGETVLSSDDDEALSPFKDFVESLDLDDLDDA